MRNKIIIGNWKMHKTIEEANDFINEFDDFALSCRDKGIVLGIAPSFLSLEALSVKAKYTLIAAQNVNEHEDGAFTGEVSIPMLKEIGIHYSIIGHSERRTYFNESNESCNLKIRALFANSMFPIYCVGETLKEYEAKKSKDVVKQQLEIGLSGLTGEQVENMIIAYEPIWSIGTGKNASHEIAEDICKFIRETIKELYNQSVSEKVLIQYGGSVKPENVQEYLSCENIDGFLVGGASLKVETFKELIKDIL